MGLLPGGAEWAEDLLGRLDEGVEVGPGEPVLPGQVPDQERCQRSSLNGARSRRTVRWWPNPP
jgi:hypothetical protein